MRANYPRIYALDNRGVPGMQHCFGAPFIAKDIDAAIDMVKESIKKYKDDLPLENFYLCELGCYVFDNFENPLESALGNEVRRCVADFFADEPGFPDDLGEDPGDEAPAISEKVSDECATFTEGDII